MGSVRASWLALAATVAAVGCGGSPEPLDLSLTSIEPQEVELGSAGQLTVRGTFEPLLVVDVDSGEVRVDERFVVLLDGAALATEFTDVQTLRAELPTDLAAGSYELIVRNPQGQQTRLQDAFTVIDPGCPPRTIDLAGECVAARRVFLSSTESNAGFGDVTGADSACQDLANTAELGGSWLAWIAENGATAPEMRLEQSLVPYVRLDGARVADDWSDLTDGTLQSPISLTETLETVDDSEVWTGTGPGGDATGDDCGNWTNTSGAMPFATVGNSGQTDSSWSDVFMQFCDRTNVRLYCIEQ